MEHWHYSKTLSSSRNVFIGVWEDVRFIGAIIFGIGAGEVCNGTAYGLAERQIAELTRVAIADHKTPISRMLAIAVRMVKKQSPGLKMLISFADSGHNHHGGIYQAAGWIYTGDYIADKKFFIVHGKLYHGRTLGSRYGVGGQSLHWLRANVDPKAYYAAVFPKHRYLFPLDAEMRAIIEPLRKPYPKRVSSVDSDTPANHAGKGGASPTDALSFQKRK